MGGERGRKRASTSEWVCRRAHVYSHVRDHASGNRQELIASLLSPLSPSPLSLFSHSVRRGAVHDFFVARLAQGKTDVVTLGHEGHFGSRRHQP